MAPAPAQSGRLTFRISGDTRSTGAGRGRGPGLASPSVARLQDAAHPIAEFVIACSQMPSRRPVDRRFPPWAQPRDDIDATVVGPSGRAAGYWAVPLLPASRASRAVRAAREHGAGIRRWTR